MRATVISTVERRRRWSAEAKARILEEALRPGANLAAIADDHGICVTVATPPPSTTSADARNSLSERAQRRKGAWLVTRLDTVTIAGLR